MVSERKLLKKIEKYSKKLEQKRYKNKERERSRSPLRLSDVEDEIPSPRPAPEEQPPVGSPDEEIPVMANEEALEVSISTEMIQALGDEYEDIKTYEGKINNDITRRWSHILTKGLSKTEKEDILKKYNIPENCKLLDAPTLNEEIETIISESGKIRDKAIIYQQRQLGIAMSIMGHVMSDIINGTFDNINMLKSLSEATKLIGDLHYQQSKTRKSLIAPQLDKHFLAMVQNINRNEYLYGENLSERIKMNKLVQQSSNAIKKTVQKPAVPLTTKNTTKKYSGNQSGPPRQINQQHQPRRAMARGGPRARAIQPSHKATPYLQRSERTRSAHYKK